MASIATALEGRGNKLGETLVALDDYLKRLNPEMPTIADDVRKLVTVLDTYDGALPDLLSLLRDVTVPMSTVSEKSAQLATLLAAATEAADSTRLFLDRHGDQLIQLGDVSRPVLELLAVYAPEYPCVFAGLRAGQPRAEAVFDDKGVVTGLTLDRPGSLDAAGYDRAIRDLTTFMEYVGEPAVLKRESIGLWVLLYLSLFTLIAWLLKHEYWRDVH